MGRLVANPYIFPRTYTTDEKLYELVERLSSTHYSGIAEAFYYLDRFIATARVLIDEYNDVGEDHADD